MNRGFIYVSHLHKIYYEIYGNDKGVPLLCFHGGPGGGFSTRYIDMIDLNKFRVIFFDQRGSGHSYPCAEIRDNTSQDAIYDAYSLLDVLGVNKCIVSGYSYGSALAFAFAERFAERVLALYVSSVFIPIDFNSVFFKQDHLLPAAYAKFINTIKTKEASKLFIEYEQCSYRRKQEIVAAIVNWELELFQIENPKFYSIEDIDIQLILSKRIFLYYVSQKFFGLGYFIKNNLHKLCDVPVTIVQGQKDKITPISVAYDIKSELLKANIIAMPNVGHIGRVITKRFYDEVNKFI